MFNIKKNKIMKKSIFTALLSLVAIVGVSFATVPPTIEVHPLAILVEPNNQFGFFWLLIPIRIDFMS